MALIVDAPMPKGCCWKLESGCFDICKFRKVCGRGLSDRPLMDEYRHPDCPIIGEIPDNHGRLIDADALLPKSGYDPMMFKHKYDGDHRTQYDTLMGYEILRIVENAPTVLEATE